MVKYSGIVPRRNQLHTRSQNVVNGHLEADDLRSDDARKYRYETALDASLIFPVSKNSQLNGCVRLRFQE